jgi:hypothetical protein
MKKLKRIIEKEYWKNKQQLYITNIYEELHDYADICLCDKKGNIIKFLFYIKTLKASFAYDLMPSYFKESREIKINDIVIDSNKPLYMNQTFTLKHFKKLTKEDIENCTKYFLREVLDCWLVFNIELIEEK